MLALILFIQGGIDLAGGKLSIIVDVEVGQNELKDLSESMKNMFEDIPLKFDDAELTALIDSFNKFKSNAQEEIMVRMNTATVLSELEQIEERFRSIKTAMESFNIDLGSATKGGLGKSFMSDVNTMSEGLKKGMSGAGTEIKSVANDIQESMRGLRSVGNADFILSGLQESTAAMKGFSAASASAAAEAKSHAAEQVAIYKELEAAIKEYYSALERMDKFQDRVDKGVATKSDLSNLAEAKVQVEQLGAALNELESSLKIGEKRELFSADFDKSAQALKEVGQNAREAKQEVNSAGNEAKQMADAYKELADIQKEINKLSKQELTAGDQESAAIREQIALLEEKAAVIRETHNLNERGNAIQEEGISKIKEAGEAERSIKAGQIGDRATEASLRASQGQKYESIFGMDRMYAYIDVMDLLREGTQLVKRQFNEFRELDGALVDIQKVAEATDTQWKGFTDTLYDNATAVGKTATEYSKSVERWAAAGFNLQEATELGSLSTMGAFVGNIDEEAMVKYMSVPLNAFKESVDATDILNVMNEVANNTAAEMDHLGQAYSRAAATASQSGTSFEELTAVLATAQEGTRLGGETIGTTWRNMDKNISSIAARGSAGAIEKFDMFAQWGVDLVDANGELRSTFDVLQDLEGVWENLNSIEKSTAAQAIGGARGLPIVQSVMENWGRVQEILNMAQGEMGMGEAGSAFREFEIQKDSLEFKIVELQNTWQSFMNSLMGGEGIEVSKGVVDGLTGIVETLQRVSENESAVSVIKGMAEGLAMMLAIDFTSSGIQKMLDSKGMLGGLRNMVTGFKEASVGAKGFGGALKGLKGAATGGGLAALPGKIMLVYAAFKALDTAIETITGRDIGEHLSRRINPLKKTIQDANAEIQNSLQNIARNDSMRRAIDEYETFANSYKEAAKARREAYEESGQLSDLDMPDHEFASLQSSHNALVEELGMPIDLKINFNDYGHIMSQIENTIEATQEMRRELARSDMNEVSKIMNSYSDIFDSVDDDVRKMRDLTKPGMREILLSGGDRNILGLGYTAARESLEKNLESPEFLEAYAGVVEATVTANQRITDALSSHNPAQELNEIISASYGEGRALAFIESFQEVMKTSDRVGEVSPKLDSLGESVSELFGGGVGDDMDSFRTKFGEVLQEFQNTDAVTDYINNLDGTLSDLFQGIAEGDEDSLSSFNGLLGVMKTSLSELDNQMSLSKDTLREYGDAIGMSALEVDALMQSYEQGNFGDVVRGFFGENDKYAVTAAAALGVAGDTLAQLHIMALDSGTTISEIMGSITDSIHDMPEGMALRLELIDDTGNIDYNQIIADLEKFDQGEFLATIGVRQEDGSIDNLDNLYDMIEGFNQVKESDLTKEMGIKFNSSDKLDVEDLMSQVEAGNLELDVTLNADGELESLEILKPGETEGIEIPLRYVPDDGSMDDALKDETKTINIEFDYQDSDGWTAEQNEAHIERLFGGTIAAEQGIEITPVFEPGENFDHGVIEGMFEEAFASETIVQHVDAKLETNFEEDGFDINVFSDALAELSYGEQLELLLEIFPELRLVGDPKTEAQQILDDAVEEEMTAKQNATVETELEYEPYDERGAPERLTLDGQTVKQPINVETEVTTDEASISEEVSSIVNKLAPMMQSETVEYDVKALINFLVENEGVAIDDVVYKLENHIGAKQIMADMGIVIDFTEEWTAEDALNQFLSEATMEQKEELLVMLYPEYEVVEGAETTGALEKVLANIMPTTASALTAEVPISLAYEINMVNEDTFSAFTEILEQDYGIEITATAETGGIDEIKRELLELPEEEQIAIIAEATGLSDLDLIMAMLEILPEERHAAIIMTMTGTETVEEAKAAIEEMDGYETYSKNTHTYETDGEEPEPVEDTESEHLIHFTVQNPQALLDLDGEDISFTVIANITDNASAGINTINAGLEAIPASKSVAITANAAGATFTIAAVAVALAALGALTVTPTIDGDKTGFDDAAAAVEGWVPPSFMVVIDADTGPFRDAVSGLSGLVPRSLSTTITASVVRSSASASIGIGNEIGRSFSNSIGSSLGLFGTSFNQQINRSQSETEEKKVNEDIWRYWAKELYDGDELANSMSELTAAINRAGDDWAKIISLSRQQISLAQEQMRFEREMSDIEQQQLDSVLSELRGYGFTTEGNKITNLDHAQNLSGDDASEAESALNTWKGLYQSIAGLGVRLAGLEGTIHGAEEAIEDARMNMELEALEKRLAKTELLLTAISNNLEILNDKDSFVGSEDYELKIKVSEENIDSSISNIQTLIDEFNQLSAMTFEFEENAEVLQGSLEKLADEIIDNADNILRFREQIIAVRLDALTDDFDRFSDAVDRNTDSLSRNVDILKEGLLSAYGTAELGNAYTVDYQRKSALEREYEERLRLAASLDAALEGYTRKNVKRSLDGTNAQLQIARDGYNELFRIQQGFTGSGMGDINSYLGNSQVSVSGSQFSRTQAKLLQHLTSYQIAYNKQIVEYNNALRGAITTRDREIVQHDMIIAQLALQEEYQNKAIVQYKEAIRLAEAELQNSAITTEQRRDLLDFIDEYREKMTDAYDVIRDAVKARFEYEFDMMDKATDKAELYYNNIAHLLDVGQMINLSPDALKPFFDAMYKASSYQYALAQEQLAQLNAQQKQFTSGSYEWNLLAEQIDNVKEAMKDITIQSLESNQAILENTMNALEKMFQVGLLGGKTLDEWKDYNEEWVDGLEKEITLESLRRKAIDAESEIIRERLNMLDRQDQVSKSDLDYIDKQLKVLELEGKLRNIERERDVQVLGRRADGTWGFDYVADQSEYDKTKEELDESRIDLEQFITEQRTNYVERLGDILGKAREGGYTDPADLRADLDLLNSIYSMVLSDIPGFTGMSFDEILAAYQEYLANNDIITDGIVDSGIGEIDDSIKGVGLTPVQQELVGVTTQLGEIIGSELRKALGATDSSGFKGPQIYQIGELVLPNVTDGDGLVNIFNDLPKAAEQAVYDKSN